MAKPLRIKRAKVSASGSKVRVDGPELTTALIQQPKEALQLLRRDAPALTVDQISVARDGRVVVNNADFARAIRDRLRSTGAAANNGICGLGCGAA